MAVLTKGTYNCACSREVCDWSCTTYATMMSDLVPNAASQPFKNLSKPFKTNADRIRSMTDEELAKFVSGTDFCELLCNDTPVCIDGQCFARLLNWLRQEAKDA